MESMISCEISKEKVKEAGEELDQEENDILKRRISSHPLYRLLLQSHIDCLKVGGEFEIINNIQNRHLNQQGNKTSSGMLRHLELDQFMEAYCLALGKLKEAMEEPQQKSMAFIESIPSQLTQFTSSTHHLYSG